MEPAARPERGRPVGDPPRYRTAWSRRLPARVLREVLLTGVLGPVVWWLGRPQVRGTSHLVDLAPPVVFAANHASHVDTPTLLRSLPGRWRRRTVVVAAADYFYKDPVRAAAVSLAFGTIPVERDGVTEVSAARMHRLLGRGWNLLLYPEGTRSRDGSIGTLHRGAAELATTHRLPLVPIGLAGTHGVLPPGASVPRRHPVVIRVGAPLTPPFDDVEALTGRLADALRDLSRAS